ncbi:MAG: Mu-like prophage major head subunit gpT family protein [Zoogloeaceae bacterium]|jgi:phage major head subunit gpT-like protein|nr:Mu-like prophage major head subunit gpT family protein [Zoogloeaceae bacterium]
MDIKQSTLNALFTGFNASFQQGFASLGDAGSVYEQICTVVNSTTATETYPWLKRLPTLREWLGDRVINQLGAADFSIRNRKFELTEGVERDAIEDDTYGLFSPLFVEFGRASREHPNTLVAEVLASNPVSYDGQPLFDADHVVLDKDGQETSVSNDMGGTGAAWYVFDLSRAIKPLIFQKRRDYQFRALTDLSDSKVFLSDRFLYGVDARVNAGPGLWQLAVRSQQALTPENYAAARQALQTLKGDYGQPLALRHTHTMVPVALEEAARRIVGASLETGGGTNPWAGTSQIIENPWL